MEQAAKNIIVFDKILQTRLLKYEIRTISYNTNESSKNHIFFHYRWGCFTWRELGKQSPYCVSIVYAWRMIGKHLNKRIQFQKF